MEPCGTPAVIVNAVEVLKSAFNRNKRTKGKKDIRNSQKQMISVGFSSHFVRGELPRYRI